MFAVAWAEVVVQPVSVSLVLRLGSYQGDRRGGLGHVTGALPDLRQLHQLVAGGHDDEVPRLPVHR